MAYVKKSDRVLVWNKYNQRCAYCGTKLEYKQLQVDHIDPFLHNDSEDSAIKYGLTKGKHEIENFNPSCARCNRWKSTFTLEQFRDEIQQQLSRLRLRSSNYRMALDFGMIVEDEKPVVFYFEKLK